MIKPIFNEKKYPNEHSKLANTYCLFFTVQTVQHNGISLHGIANTVCLLKPIFNDKKYPNFTQYTI